MGGLICTARYRGAAATGDLEKRQLWRGKRDRATFLFS